MVFMLSMIQNKIHLRLRVVSTECWKKQDPYLNFDWNWNNQVKKRFFYPMCSNEYFQILPQNAPFCVKFLQNFPGPRTPLALFPPDCQFSILDSLVHNFYLNLCSLVWQGYHSDQERQWKLNLYDAWGWKISAQSARLLGESACALFG